MASSNKNTSGRKLGFSLLLLTILHLSLVACAGGGGSGGSPSPPPSPTFSYPSTPLFVINTPIAPVIPTGTAGLSNFSLRGASLPFGLTLDSNTGVISGTPTVIAGPGTWTIYASGAAATSVSATVKIHIGIIAANALSYGAAAFTFTSNIPANPLTPVTAGEAVTGWSIAPQLPPGLAFNNTDGTISGNPNKPSPPTTYTVSAYSSAGPISTSFSIRIEPDLLVNLGHGAGITFLEFNGSTLLSVDQFGHWVLWNYATAATTNRGDTACVACAMGPVAGLAGSAAVIRTDNGFEVLSSTTGNSLATINTSGSWWRFAQDGSYLVVGGPMGLTAWSPVGTVLVSRKGDYSAAVAFASPGAIRIADGPAGANVIETVSMPDGADTISATFNGTFSSWFVDGSAFFTGVGNTAFIYSNAVAQEAAFTATASSLSGMGPWFWSGALNIYAVSAPTTVVASYAFPNFYGSVVASGTTLGVINTTTDILSVIDLSGAAPSKVDYVLPIGTPQGISSPTTYAATSASRWIVGSDYGVLLDGANLSGSPRFFGYGQAISLAANANRIAVSTASGTVLYFNAVTLAQEGTIQFTSDDLALSPDGSILAAAPSGLNGPVLGGQVVNVYSLPAGSTLYSWPSQLPALPTPERVSLAGTGVGSVLAQAPSGNGACTAMISAPAGGTPSFCSKTDALVDLSPSGTVFATSATLNPYGSSIPFTDFGTNFYQNDKLVSAVPGWPAGWIDNSHLLVNFYAPQYYTPQFTEYQGCAVYGPTGASAGTCLLPEVLAFQTVDSSSIYANNVNQIINISTGVVEWASGNPLANNSLEPAQVLNFLSGLAGAHVVFVSGAYVVAQSHP